MNNGLENPLLIANNSENTNNSSLGEVKGCML